MYPYNTPGAFVPHSAINISVKANEVAANAAPMASSLDLTMSDGTAASAATAAAAAAAVTSLNQNNTASITSTGSSVTGSTGETITYDL